MKSSCVCVSVQGEVTLGGEWAGKCFWVNTQIFLSPLETTFARKPEIFKAGFCIKFQDYANEQTKAPSPTPRALSGYPKTLLTGCWVVFKPETSTQPQSLLKRWNIWRCVCVCLCLQRDPLHQAWVSSELVNWLQILNQGCDWSWDVGKNPPGDKDYFS